MATIFIDPSATEQPGNGTGSRPYHSLAEVEIKAGDVVLVRAGTTMSGMFSIVAKGTEAAPVIIAPYGTGPAPVIEGMINVDGASYVTIIGLAVRDTGAAAIAIQDGSHHITIAGNTLSQAAIGVWLGNGTGGDNLIVGNTIIDSSYLGIAVDQVANAEGHASVIANNVITGSAAHGIELHGNNFIVAGNTVSRSGLVISGASGIHVLGGADGVADGYGVGNVIVNNVSTDNQDVWGYDGNGIQLDQFTHGNVVAGNFATGNDGAGLVLYDSYDNIVIGNVLDGNQRDPGGTHPLKADVLLAGSFDLTDGNFILENVGLSLAGPAVLVDMATADNANLFSGNVWQNTAGGADTVVGLDSTWAGWVGGEMTGQAPDSETGVALATGASGDALAYSFAAGTTRVIDGVDHTLLGWSGTQLVVAGEAVM